MRRVLIIGNAGTGKTTFARALAEKTGLPVVHMDREYGQEALKSFLFAIRFLP